MNKLFAKLISAVVAVLVVTIFVLGFLAYFVNSFDRATGVWLDGLGRPLERAPFIARFIFGADRLWPGWGWFAVDYGG